ncbi:hypothetical protein ACFQ4J_12355 [Laceyella tengchongensis]|jgi:hypothetical protein
MVTKMLQGLGAGFVASILLGYIVGVTGLILNAAGPIMLMVLTYMVAGWVTGRNNEYALISAWFVASVMFFINTFISVNVLGEINIPLIGLIFGWIFAMLGAWIGKRKSTLSQKGV